MKNVVDSHLGDILIRPYEKKDIVTHKKYLFESKKEFLESIGFDPKKFPTLEAWEKFMIELTEKEKTEKMLPVRIVSELDGKTVSMTYLDQKRDDKKTRLHFHIFDESLRGKGLGSIIFPETVKMFSEAHELNQFFIEPKTTNLQMNRLMKKLGYQHLKDYELPEGNMTYTMMVSQYEIHTA